MDQLEKPVRWWHSLRRYFGFGSVNLSADRSRAGSGQVSSALGTCPGSCPEGSEVAKTTQRPLRAHETGSSTAMDTVSTPVDTSVGSEPAALEVRCRKCRLLREQWHISSCTVAGEHAA
jgi:hypothetical protein